MYMHMHTHTHKVHICSYIHMQSTYILFCNKANETHMHNFEFTYTHISKDKCIKIV